MGHMVVTGTSTGLGKAIAAEARRRGWDVLGTVRRPADRAVLDDIGAASVIMDVTDAQSVAAGAEDISDWCGGRLACLVNNAGTAYAGPVEELELDDLRGQLEVNVVGQIAVTQALLPRIRAARGTIAMISSDSAATTAPLLGAYAASKRALEAMAEALDLELSGQGVRTLVIRPGAFETAIWDTTVERSSKYETGGSRYFDLAQKVKEYALDGDRLREPEDLARHALGAIENPRSAFVTTYPRSVEGTVAPLLPWRVYKYAVRRTLGLGKG